MRKIYNLSVSILMLVLYFGQSITGAEAAVCNWKSRNASTMFWDSCKTGKGNRLALNGSINFSSSACLKYEWSVNGNSAGTGMVMNYPVLSNGTYSICVKVRDTCNNCDTTYCTSRDFTCAPKTFCNFKSRTPFTFFWDSCNGKKSKYLLNAYISFHSFYCLGYEWSVNGKYAGKGFNISYPVSKNGTYRVCVRVKDTCSNCDTTICQDWTFYCSGASCNWKSRKPVFKAGDTCTASNYNVKGSLDLAGNKNCYTYRWTVAGSDGGLTNTMTYSLADGNWNICLKVQDTCGSCDTTFCKYIKVDCNGPAGLERINSIKLLKVYPNPAEGNVNIEWPAEKAAYDIQNTSGQTVQSGFLEKGLNNFNLNNYTGGLYLIKVYSGNTVLTGKISVQRK